MLCLIIYVCICTLDWYQFLWVKKICVTEKGEWYLCIYRIADIKKFLERCTWQKKKVELPLCKHRYEFRNLEHQPTTHIYKLSIDIFCVRWDGYKHPSFQNWKYYTPATTVLHFYTNAWTWMMKHLLAVSPASDIFA